MFINDWKAFYRDKHELKFKWEIKFIKARFRKREVDLENQKSPKMTTLDGGKNWRSTNPILSRKKVQLKSILISRPISCPCGQVTKSG